MGKKAKRQWEVLSDEYHALGGNFQAERKFMDELKRKHESGEIDSYEFNQFHEWRRKHDP